MFLRPVRPPQTLRGHPQAGRSFSERGRIAAVLVIVADDYGYAGAYDDGILAAVRAQAVDAVGVMVLRDPPAEILLEACAEAQIDVGLHLESLADASLNTQLDAFRRLFGRPPAYVDGHHHCHAADPDTARHVALAALEHGIPVRAVGEGHRALLRGLGVATADRLVGRLDEAEPLVPEEIDALLAGTGLSGATEWMVHPGRAGGPSSYDAGRERDLEELLRLGDRASWRSRGILRAPPSRAGLR